MKPKVYIETSVISYFAARPSRDILIAANQQVTQEWWLERRQQALIDCNYLDITPEAIELAEKLIEQNAIPRKAAEDALHIAIATVGGMDYLITWNFKHIANATMRANVELVCRLNGYEPPVICSPMELMEA
ncbi:MAG: type II toxin-antitoxin system VapC family toxin [Chloroflexota bacterium]